MEFTHDGLVRYAFGFYNPNHAAALICAILPLVWLLIFSKPVAKRLAGLALTLVLLIALAFTYSRAGALVLAIEVLLFAIYYGRKHWKVFVGVAIIFTTSIILVGGLSRITYDNSIANRIDIYLAGFAFFAQNLQGVGLGNSGEIISAYILPDDIAVSTLINSHLTILAELGILIGFVWLTTITYALLNVSKEKFAVFVSVVGLIISSSISTVLNFEFVLYPQNFEHYTSINTTMSYAIFAFFVGLVIYLEYGNFSKKKLILSATISLSVLSLIIAIGKVLNQSPTVDKIEGDVFVIETSKSPKSLVLFDDDYRIKDAINILKQHNLSDGACISLKSWQLKQNLPKIKTQQIILFGECADFISANESDYILINPSEYFVPTTKNIKQVYLPKYDRKYNRVKIKYIEKNIEIFDL